MYLFLLALIYIAFISLGLPDSLLGSGWPVMHAELGVPVSYMGIISMIISGGTVVSSLFSDKMTRKFGTRIVTVASVFLTVIALFGFSFSSQFWMLAVFAVPYGLGAGAIDSALNNYVALHYKAKHMSWLHCFWGVGTIVSPFIMSYALANRTWNSGYRMVGLIQLGIALLLLVTLPVWNVNQSTSREDGKSVGLTGALKIKGVPFLLLGFFVTGPVEDDGLNFSYKWNMGWMHDFLDYMKLDPYFRRDNHHKMTFAMSYNESEKYILVLSHDEVVHLKCSMINKMPGLGIDKFRNLMVGYAFMMGHPGKKLLFMGQEFAQLREWSEERELDWFLLDNPDHKHIQNWVKKLLHIYRKNPALYELDSSWGGFEWINANDADRSIYSFIRWSPTKRNNLLFVCNFTPVERKDYWVGVPQKKQCKLILSSADPAYGGQHHVDNPVFKPVKGECDGQPYHVAYPLAPYEVAVFAFN